MAIPARLDRTPPTHFDIFHQPHIDDVVILFEGKQIVPVLDISNGPFWTEVDCVKGFGKRRCCKDCDFVVTVQGNFTVRWNDAYKAKLAAEDKAERERLEAFWGAPFNEIWIDELTYWPTFVRKEHVLPFGFTQEAQRDLKLTKTSKVGEVSETMTMEIKVNAASVFDVIDKMGALIARYEVYKAPNTTPAWWCLSKNHSTGPFETEDAAWAFAVKNHKGRLAQKVSTEASEVVALRNTLSTEQAIRKSREAECQVLRDTIKRKDEVIAAKITGFGNIIEQKDLQIGRQAQAMNGLQSQLGLQAGEIKNLRDDNEEAARVIRDLTNKEIKLRQALHVIVGEGRGITYNFAALLNHVIGIAREALK